MSGRRSEDSPLSIGDRVLIFGGHPWSGHTGEIREPFRPDMGLDWVVALDNGCCPAASVKQLRRVQ